jgi:hypothetical protein
LGYTDLVYGGLLCSTDYSVCDRSGLRMFAYFLGEFGLDRAHFYMAGCLDACYLLLYLSVSVQLPV